MENVYLLENTLLINESIEDVKEKGKKIAHLIAQKIKQISTFIKQKVILFLKKISSFILSLANKIKGMRVIKFECDLTKVSQAFNSASVKIDSGLTALPSVKDNHSASKVYSYFKEANDLMEDSVRLSNHELNDSTKQFLISVSSLYNIQKVFSNNIKRFEEDVKELDMVYDRMFNNKKEIPNSTFDIMVQLINEGQKSLNNYLKMAASIIKILSSFKLGETKKDEKK